MTLRGMLLGTAALAVVATPAFADDTAILRRLDAMQRTMELQQKQLAAQRDQIAALRNALRHRGVNVAPAADNTPPPSTPVEARVAQQQVEIDQLVDRFAATEDRARVEKADRPSWSVAGGRPTV